MKGAEGPESGGVTLPTLKAHVLAKEDAVSTWEEIVTPDRFDGQTVIVRGAAWDIGRATALRVASGGGRVVASDLNSEGLEKLGAIANPAVTCVVHATKRA